MVSGGHHGLLGAAKKHSDGRPDLASPRLEESVLCANGAGGKFRFVAFRPTVRLIQINQKSLFGRLLVL